MDKTTKPKEEDIISNLSHKYITDDLTLTKREVRDYLKIDKVNCLKWTDDRGTFIKIKGLATFKIQDDNKNPEDMFKRSV